MKGMRIITASILILSLSSCAQLAKFGLGAITASKPGISASAQIGKTNTKQVVGNQSTSSVQGNQTNTSTTINNVPWWAMTPMGWIVTFLIGMYSWLHLPRASEMWSIVRRKKK